MNAARWVRMALACVIGVPLCAAAQTCERMPVRASDVQSIGGDMLVNGMPAAVWSVSFDMSATDVERAFRQYWDREGLPSVGMSGERGFTMSGLDGVCQYVLELPAGQRGAFSRGVMSVMRLDPGGVRHAVPASAAQLPGGPILTDVESRDPGRAGRTWVVSLTGRVEDRAANYRDELARAGWHALSYKVVHRAEGRRAPNVGLAMQRGAYQLDAVFSGQAGQATAVINVMESR